MKPVPCTTDDDCPNLHNLDIYSRYGSAAQRRGSNLIADCRLHVEFSEDRFRLLELSFRVLSVCHVPVKMLVLHVCMKDLLARPEEVYER